MFKIDRMQVADQLATMPEDDLRCLKDWIETEISRRESVGSSIIDIYNGLKTVTGKPDPYIDTIKAYGDRTGYNLRAAKAYVDVALAGVRP